MIVISTADCRLLELVKLTANHSTTFRIARSLFASQGQLKVTAAAGLCQTIQGWCGLKRCECAAKVARWRGGEAAGDR